MRRLTLLIAIAAACGDRSAGSGWPPLTPSDLSCKTDADCTTRGRTCCTGCGGSPGTVMNASRAAKDDAARAEICRDEKCPEENCEMPACWEDEEPYCDRGTCAVRMVKRGSCGPAAPSDASPPG